MERGPQRTSMLATAVLLLLLAVAAGGAAVPAAGEEAVSPQATAAAPPAIKPLPEAPPEPSREAIHGAMQVYLDRFFKQQQEEAAAAAAANSTAANSDKHKSRSSSLLEKLVGKQQEDTCGPGRRDQRPVERRYLVVLPAGDEFDASKWMAWPQQANWDLIILYYGTNPSFACPLCKAVYAATGPKWRLAWRFTLLPEWQQYKLQYKAILIPDDDLVVDSSAQCTINRLFELFTTYKLLLAQPSLCVAAWSYTPWKELYQQKANVLRYTTFVEIMAPVFDMDFFDSFIRPSIFSAHYGWGLDFSWPFLLRYPRNKIAVIDEVCVYHPPSTPAKTNSVYAAGAPFHHKEEEARHFAEYGYFESEIQKRGFWYQPVAVLGHVPQPVPEESLLETSNKLLQARLGALYPVLLLGQTLLISLGCLGVACMRVRRWRQHRWPAPAGGQQYQRLSSPKAHRHSISAAL